MNENINDIFKHDLIIYSKNIDLYLKNINILKQEIQILTENFVFPITLSFHIFPDDLSKNMGVKIRQLLNKLKQEKINFRLYHLPPCLFKNETPSDVNTHFIKEQNKIPTFLQADNGIKHVHSNTDITLLQQEKASVFLKCIACHLRKNKKCKGIFILPGSYLCSKKVEEWLFSKLNSSKNIKLLDIGCGAEPPFLDLYKQITKKGSTIYLVDPSLASLFVLKKVIPRCYKNIILVHDTAENLKLGNNKFDVVILLASYSHLMNLHQSFTNIKKSLKQNGVLIIRDEQDLISTKLNEKGEPFSYHLRNHSLKQAILELQKYNFEVIDSCFEKTNTEIIWALQAQINKKA